MTDAVDQDLGKGSKHTFPPMTEERWTKLLEGAKHSKPEVDDENAFIPYYVSTPFTINEVT